MRGKYSYKICPPARPANGSSLERIANLFYLIELNTLQIKRDFTSFARAFRAGDTFFQFSERDAANQKIYSGRASILFQ